MSEHNENLPPGTTDGEDSGAAAQAPRLAEAMGRLPLPVKGQIETVFGEPVESGELSSGITISARDGAQVIAPFDGRIAFAGPFLDYQQLLLMDAGEGYHFLFIGMARLYGRVGDRLLAGEPIGVMGSSMQDEETGDIEAPTLYIEFRKDGEPINPLPWLAATERKVSG